MKTAHFLFIVAALYTGVLYIPLKVYAQNVDSGNYTLVNPDTQGEEPIQSSNYSSLVTIGNVNSFALNSANYSLEGGVKNFSNTSVPQILCAETNTESGTTDCLGIYGSQGMLGVCSFPGCFDRAKIEINPSGNALDARYAIQISTTSDFSANVSYIDPTVRTLKSSLVATDFIYKCEWEGTTASPFCASDNITYQKFNVFGLDQNQTYYVRTSAIQAVTSQDVFTHTAWSPAVSFTTESTYLSIDVDIALTEATSTIPPHVLNFGNVLTDVVVTATDKIFIKLTTNAQSGLILNVKSENAGLDNGVNVVPSVNGDLDVLSEGFGIINVSSTNSQDNTTGELGVITVSNAPSTFQENLGTGKVGQVPVTYVPLFTSNSKPLLDGVSGFSAKLKFPNAVESGTYEETISILPTPQF